MYIMRFVGNKCTLHTTINRNNRIQIMNNLEETQLAEVENDYWVGLNKDLTELEADPRFQRLITNGYFKDFVINQTSMLASDRTIMEGKRGLIQEQLVAVSHLQEHFMMIKNIGSIPTEEEAEDQELELQGQGE